MKMRRIPKGIVDFTERVLTDRKTQLHFDGFTSDWININNSIGQGDPLSMILYIIYSADLVDIAEPHHRRTVLRELTLAFVDDTAFVAIGPDFVDTHATLKNMLECPGGGFDWSSNHNSCFETNKFALIDFSMNKNRLWPPMLIQGVTILPSAIHRFLGVILDQELHWKAQVDHAIAKGMAYIMQLRRLTTMSKGIPLCLMRQLYQAMAVPKMLYAADLWFTPAFRDGSDIPQHGSLGVVRRLTSVQRIAAISMTGVMRSSATDTLEAHANLLPISLHLQNICH
ncbi:hypothetical protein AZE42_10041 [Rhizopogon vesiculosus]|uniref:Reverse transcriptase domain-containing protein n=1 Tax=Rhizopogon vesiculosus TaxID=180088 RepID=A0A1J8QGA3_9AGAM|nr:hypothetical protein AZE42_10041 [Rhizopogon vesiculosus]